MGNTTGKAQTTRPRSIEEFEEKHRGSLVSSHSQRNLEEGICHGMCLDWIRLVLHEHGGTFREYSRMEHGSVKTVFMLQNNLHNWFLQSAERRIKELLQESRQSIRRMELAHEEQERIRAQAFPAVQAERALKLVLRSGFVDLADAGNLRTVLQGQGLFLDRQTDRVEVLEESLRRLGQRVQEIKREMKDDERMFPHYYHYFRELVRKGVGHEDTFDDIEFFPAERESWSEKTLDDWFAKIRACLHQLRDGRCALLNFCGSKSGHYVAFHRSGTAYSLFDPNTGWYRTGNADQVWDMFQDLWYAAYRRFGYKESTWRVFFRTILWDPKLPLGHAFL